MVAVCVLQLCGGSVCVTIVWWQCVCYSCVVAVCVLQLCGGCVCVTVVWWQCVCVTVVWWLCIDVLLGDRGVFL